MADLAEVVRLSRAELVARKEVLDAHVAVCCGAQDGTCGLLVEVGAVQYLLDKEGDDAG